MLRTVTATRYVTPLREGGSLPALVEADDDGLYVVKLLGRGARPEGAGRRAPGGRDRPPPRAPRAGPGAGRARRRPRQGRAEPRDPGPARAVGRAPTSASTSCPARWPSSPAVGPAPDPDLAAAVVWLDAYTTNVDRTPRNPNLIVWHRRLHLIDHGSALYIHHTWRDPAEHARRPFEPIRDHVLLPFASSIADADARLAPLVTARLVSGPGRRRSPTTGCRPRPACPIPTPIARAYVDYLAGAARGAARVRRGGRSCPGRVSRSSTRSCASCRAWTAARRSTRGSS